MRGSHAVVLVAAMGIVGLALPRLFDSVPTPAAAPRADAARVVPQAIAAADDAAPAAPKWRTRRSTSPIDDSPTVQLLVESRDPIADRRGLPATARLLISCRENRTDLAVLFADVPIAWDLTRVTLRIDEQPAETLGMMATRERTGVGLWGGGESIPLLRRLFDHDRLLVAVKPVTRARVTAVFPIWGLREAIAPLAAACHWRP